MKQNTYYFSHDATARKDEKILCLIADHGYEGYGIYWALIEMMFEAPDTCISKVALKGIAYDLRIELALLNKIVGSCYKAGLFTASEGKFWSDRIRRNKDEFLAKKAQKSEAGKRGMQARWGSNNTVITKPNGAITKHNKVKESKGKKSISFIPPLQGEVRTFFLENGYSQDAADKAFEYYAEGEWQDAKGNPVKNWKQKMRGVWFRDEHKTVVAPVIDLAAERMAMDLKIREKYGR